MFKAREREDDEAGEEMKYSSNKPLALQRILLENGTVICRSRTKIKDKDSASRLLSEDKENCDVGNLNSQTETSKIRDDEQDWFPEEQIMSSTVMERNTPERLGKPSIDNSSIFTTSDNLSSIGHPGDKLLFKTPKRREEWREAPSANSFTPRFVCESNVHDISHTPQQFFGEDSKLWIVDKNTRFYRKT